MAAGPPMRRVLVRGCSGSGKTTFAAALAERLGVPHVELDGLFHLPDWQPRAPEDFRAAVAGATAGDRWVADGNHALARPVLRDRVDTVVWLDLPRWRVVARVLRRTTWRLLTRAELWNTNRESLRNVVSRDPEQHRAVVLDPVAALPPRGTGGGRRPGMAPRTLFRLTSPRRVDEFLARVESAATS